MVIEILLPLQRNITIPDDAFFEPSYRTRFYGCYIVEKPYMEKAFVMCFVLDYLKALETLRIRQGA